MMMREPCYFVPDACMHLLENNVAVVDAWCQFADVVPDDVFETLPYACDLPSGLIHNDNALLDVEKWCRTTETGIH